jgi:hypothetical protein
MTLKISNIFYEKFPYKSTKSHVKLLALCMSECLGSDPKLDPKLFTSRIRIRNYFFRIRIQNSAENGIQIRIRKK